ncbi:MAG: hypothetical protein ACOY0T_29005 [Myxococcota bacterium]
MILLVVRVTRGRVLGGPTLLVGCGFVAAFLSGLSLWGASPSDEAGVLGFALGVVMTALGSAAAVILLRCLPPAELRVNAVALLFGCVSVGLGAMVVSETDARRVVPAHAHRGW